MHTRLVSAVFAALIVGAFAAVSTAAADRLGMLAHFELCENGDWMSLDDIAVNASTGDIWLEGGTPFPALVHATTTGAVIGSHDGSGIPNEFSNSFGVSFEVTFGLTGVYVADANDRYQHGRGRLLKFTPARYPVFAQHFTQPGLSPPGTGFGPPVDAQGALFDGVPYIVALDQYRLLFYQEDGTFAASLLPPPGDGFVDPGDFPGGMAFAGPFVLVADPRNGKVKPYGLTRDPDGRPSSLRHYPGDLRIKARRMYGAPDGSVYALTREGLGHYTGVLGGGALIEEVKLEGAKGLHVDRSGDVWITRNDGILRLGPGGDPIPDLQNGYPQHRCGAPRISRSVPSSQDIDATGQIVIVAGCNEACRMRLSGTLTVPDSSKTAQTARRATRTYRLRPSSRRFKRAGRARMHVRLANPARKALRAAKQHSRVSSARITMTATDTGGAVRRRPLRLYLR